MLTCSSNSPRLQLSSQKWGQTRPQTAGRGFFSANYVKGLSQLAFTNQTHIFGDMGVSGTCLGTRSNSLLKHWQESSPGPGLVSGSILSGNWEVLDIVQQALLLFAIFRPQSLQEISSSQPFNPLPLHQCTVTFTLSQQICLFESGNILFCTRQDKFLYPFNNAFRFN